MNVQIITPDKELFSGEADSIVVPGTDGLLGVLNHHAPLPSSLKQGSVKVVFQKQEQFFEINGGVVEVLNNNVIILAT